MTLTVDAPLETKNIGPSDDLSTGKINLLAPGATTVTKTAPKAVAGRMFFVEAKPLLGASGVVPAIISPDGSDDFLFDIEDGLVSSITVQENDFLLFTCRTNGRWNVSQINTPWLSRPSDFSVKVVSIDPDVLNSDIIVPWNLGGGNGEGFPITSSYFQISNDPSVPGVINAEYPIEDGETLDLYVVGPAVNRTTGGDGLPNTNGQISGFHFTVTRSGSTLVYAVGSSGGRITGGLPNIGVTYSTTAYNDLDPTAAGVWSNSTIPNAFDVISGVQPKQVLISACSTENKAPGEIGKIVINPEGNFVSPVTVEVLSSENLDSVSASPIIDLLTSEVSWEVFYTIPPAPLVNDGRGCVTLLATDGGNNQSIVSVPVQAAKPLVEPLGCNDDVLVFDKELDQKSAMHILPVAGKVFSDVAGTVAAVDGGPVLSVLESADDGLLTEQGAAPLWLKMGGPKGLPALDINVNGDHLAGPLVGALAPGSPFTVNVVARIDNLADNGSIFSSTSVAQPNGQGAGALQLMQSGGELRLLHSGGFTNVTAGVYDGATGTGAAIVMAATDSEWRLYTIDYDGTTISILRDGELMGRGDPVAPLFMEFVKYGKNRTNTASGVLAVSIAESIIGSAYTAAEKARAFAYFVCKHGTQDLSVDVYGIDKTKAYPVLSPYVLQVYQDGSEFVANTFTEEVFALNQVPFPGLARYAPRSVITALQSKVAVPSVMVGTTFLDAFRVPEPGKLYAGETHNWADNPILSAKFSAQPNGFIVDNTDGTFTVVDHQDFIRPGSSNVGVHVDDTTAVNGLTGVYVRYNSIPTNSSTGGNNGRWRGTTNQQVNLSGDAETAPNHRTAYFGIYGG